MVDRASFSRIFPSFFADRKFPRLGPPVRIRVALFLSILVGEPSPKKLGEKGAGGLFFKVSPSRESLSVHATSPGRMGVHSATSTPFFATRKCPRSHSLSHLVVSFIQESQTVHATSPSRLFRAAIANVQLGPPDLRVPLFLLSIFAGEPSQPRKEAVTKHTWGDLSSSSHIFWRCRVSSRRCRVSPSRSPRAAWGTAPPGAPPGTAPAAEWRAARGARSSPSACHGSGAPSLHRSTGKNAGEGLGG